MDKVKSFCFLDWCPVPYIGSFGDCVDEIGNFEACDGEEYSQTTLNSSFYEHIKIDNERAINKVHFARRRDGIFIFRLEFENPIDHRDTIDWATEISNLIKERVFHHKHVFHVAGSRLKISTASFQPHNPVLMQEVASKNFLGHLKEVITDKKLLKEIDNREKDDSWTSLPIDQKLEYILSEDCYLYSVLALFRDGRMSDRPACLVLKHFHARKRDDVYLIRDHWKKKEGIFTINWKAESIFYGFCSFSAMFVLLLSLSNENKWVLFIVSLLFGVALFLLFLLFFSAKEKFVPIRRDILSIIGYLNTCSIYAKIVYCVACNAETKSCCSFSPSAVESPFEWTVPSIEPILRQETDIYTNFTQLVAAALTVLALIVGIVAILASSGASV